MLPHVSSGLPLIFSRDLCQMWCPSPEHVVETDNAVSTLICPVWWYLHCLSLPIQCTPVTVKEILAVRTTLSVSARFLTGSPQWANEALQRRGQLAACNKLLCFDISAVVAVRRSSQETSWRSTLALNKPLILENLLTEWIIIIKHAYCHWVNNCEAWFSCISSQ